MRNGYFDVDFRLEASWLPHMRIFLLAAQLKSAVVLSLQSTLHAALFLLSPWQLGSWFDSICVFIRLFNKIIIQMKLYSGFAMRFSS